ncbi:nucleoside 2-deoxyribosyltransferase domain-containing protein [Maribellus sediminis]|uniref:nucleoside 2-deoxyribosyltransferase domain-containing protein n=1 Tax=Maribellus sediminis TaxID=2696285 RepID=UPI001430DFB9|nr:nucleoside 2-deoxyribosyltransferase domain-containing protein [Maribellus sediminis]
MEAKEKVYLAGGMESDWHEKLKQRFHNKFLFYNPKDHQLDASEQYTLWDLHHIKKSDIVFAYLEKDNPSGYGLTLEVGYAKALNKTIILVDEKSDTNNEFKARFAIVKNSASAVFDNLEEGIKFLERFSIYVG